ncbi:nucleoside deaminase [Pontiellaceae bacterium B12227]|nr:nucleoside deaminase [Pontiellaceae bacterium B12227]
MSYSEQFLREAIRLSEEKMKAGEGGPFAAVIVQDGTIISKGWNCVTSENDPTAHGEMEAIRKACATLKTFSLEGCEIYSSCEPCPMCLSAIYWARLDALYFAGSMADAAAAGFDDRFFYDEVSKPWNARTLKTEQALQNEAQKVFKAWINNPGKAEY